MSDARRAGPKGAGWIARIVLSIALGVATTVGFAWASAAWMPLDKAGGLVAKDGDHLQPWQLLLRRPGAERLIWFEKGRVYNKGGVGPPNASSAAVTCWSFATSTRQNPSIVKADFPLTDHMQQLIAAGPPQPIWGVAEDRRGWPWPAMRCWFTGTMSPSAPSEWAVESGGALKNSLTVRENLATLRALPHAPIWPGFAADVAVHSAAWLMLLVAVQSVTAWILAKWRKPAGCCPKCGYDLRGDFGPGCPECGWNRAIGGGDPEAAA
jgi:hypothetical protein